MVTYNIYFERHPLSQVNIYFCKCYIIYKLDFNKHIISIQIKLSKIIYTLKYTLFII